MASLLPSIFVLAILLLSAANAKNIPTLAVRKDRKTSQFYTSFEMGSNRATINAVIDLGGPYLWFSCDDYKSNSYSPIPCNSAKCDVARGDGCYTCYSPPRPGCSNDTCGSSPSNPFQEVALARGFGEDTFYAKNHLSFSEFPFACMDKEFLGGMARGTTGLLGLGRTNISLHKQVAINFNSPDRFSLCIPSSGIGKLSVGVSPYTKPDIAKSLKATPLIINPVSAIPSEMRGDPSSEYFVDVKSILVDGVRLPVKDSYFSIDQYGDGGTKISTIQNFTVLHNSIYKPLTGAFVKAASNMKIKRVAAVPPFRACFSSDSIAKTPTGPSVPEIDLVLPGNDMHWKLRGANLMVAIDQKTTCLGLVDGGTFPRTSIVIGAHQLEENYLEFDLVSSQLRFSSSLLLLNRSCSSL